MLTKMRRGGKLHMGHCLWDLDGEQHKTRQIHRLRSKIEHIKLMQHCIGQECGNAHLDAAFPGVLTISGGL